jgi:DinB family protein
VTGFSEIPDLVLGPLAGRPEADWYKAPPGKWCAAQIVQHLAIGIDGSGRTFESRRGKPPMQRRPRTMGQRLGRFLVLQLGWIMPGRESPPGVRPAERPDPASVERQLREGVARWLRLETELLTRARDLFVKHPYLGDLTLPEWLRFHALHSAHHAKQIRARLAS